MFDFASYERYRDGNHVFSDVFGLAPFTTQSRTGGEPIGAEVVTGNFFQALGVRPALGAPAGSRRMTGPARPLSPW
jgi:hypothetical protein